MADFQANHRRIITVNAKRLCYSETGGCLMTAQTGKAIVHWAGQDLFVGISPSGHAVTIDTDPT